MLFFLFLSFFCFFLFSFFLCSVYDQAQVLRVPEAVVFDSNTWFFLRGGEAALSTSLTFPGGFFYHFRVLGPSGQARLSARFIITSSFEGKEPSSISMSPMKNSNSNSNNNSNTSHQISMKPLSFSNSFGSPQQSRKIALQASNRAAHKINSPEFPRRDNTNQRYRYDETNSGSGSGSGSGRTSFDGGASLRLPELGSSVNNYTNGNGGNGGNGNENFVVGNNSSNVRRELPAVKKSGQSFCDNDNNTTKGKTTTAATAATTTTKLMQYESKSPESQRIIADEAQEEQEEKEKQEEIQDIEEEKLSPNTVPIVATAIKKKRRRESIAISPSQGIGSFLTLQHGNNEPETMH